MNEERTIKQQMRTTARTPPPFAEDEAIKFKVRGTTYVVTSRYNENAREGLLDKIWRLIENDTD